jgi:periplasmic copper chaperone A
LRHLILAAFIALAACNSAPKAPVTDAVVQLPAATGRPGVAYFTLNGGAAEARLMEIKSPQVIRVELHDMVMKDGMMSMQKIEGGVAVPAGGAVAFKKGGKHAMLFDVNPAVKVGDEVALQFTYADGQSVEVKAKAAAPGAAGGEHQH